MFRDLRLRHLGWPCVGPMILPLTLWLLSGQVIIVSQQTECGKNWNRAADLPNEV